MTKVCKLLDIAYASADFHLVYAYATDPLDHSTTGLDMSSIFHNVNYFPWISMVMFYILYEAGLPEAASFAQVTSLRPLGVLIYMCSRIGEAERLLQTPLKVRLRNQDF